MRNLKITLSIFVTIFFIGLFTLYPSFDLALFGDDWLAFFRFRQHVDPGFSKYWNYLTYYLTPYGAQDILMGLLHKIYGYNSSSFYFASFILRTLAAFSFFPLVYYLTKNKLSAFFASCFFLVTVIGLDTTNWVFNMPTYITIALFNIFLYFFILNRDNPKLKILLLAGVIYYFAYITTPIRMHGSLIFLFLLEAFWVVQERNTKVFKRAAVRFAVILGVFLFVRFTGHSQGPPEETSQRFFLGVKTMSEMLGTGRFDFIFYPIVMLGSMIVPDLLSPQIQVNSTRSLLPMVSMTFTGFSVILFSLTRYIEQVKSNFFKPVIITAVAWSIFILFIYKTHLDTLSNSSLLFSLLIGGYLMILTIFLIMKFCSQKLLSTALFLGLFWSIMSFFFAWWWVPVSIFPTIYRYLIVSAAGIAILLSSFISLSKKRSHQFVLFFMLLPFILINIWSSRIFLNYSLIGHNQQVSDKIWKSIPIIPEVTKTKEPLIFYFEGDGTNGLTLHNVITFGFPPHMALIYNMQEGDPIPIPMSEFKDIVSAVVDGKTMLAHGYKAKPVDINRIYAFRLVGQDDLIDITTEVRRKLEEVRGN